MRPSSIIPKIDSARYLGEWVLICDEKVVAHDKDLLRIKKEISLCKTTPTLARIPKKDTLIF